MEVAFTGDVRNSGVGVRTVGPGRGATSLVAIQGVTSTASATTGPVSASPVGMGDTVHWVRVNVVANGCDDTSRVTNQQLLFFPTP